MLKIEVFNAEGKRLSDFETLTVLSALLHRPSISEPINIRRSGGTYLWFDASRFHIHVQELGKNDA